MIDNLSLLISHGLILLACWRLLQRRDLDDESAHGARGWRRHSASTTKTGDADA